MNKRVTIHTEIIKLLSSLVIIELNRMIRGSRDLSFIKRNSIVNYLHIHKKKRTRPILLLRAIYLFVIKTVSYFRKKKTPIVVQFMVVFI